MFDEIFVSCAEKNVSIAFHNRHPEKETMLAFSGPGLAAVPRRNEPASAKKAEHDPSPPPFRRDPSLVSPRSRARGIALAAAWRTHGEKRSHARAREPSVDANLSGPVLGCIDVIFSEK